MNTIGQVKIFVKDTAELWKYEAKYVKNHWKGLVIISGVVIGAEIGTVYHQNKKWKKEKRRREEEYKKSVKEWTDRINIEYEIEE